MSSPLHQFEIHTVLPLTVAGYDISLTNSSVFMFLAVITSTLFLVLGMKKKALIPGRFQAAAEMLHNSVANIVSDTAGENSKPYFPLIFSIFIFILSCNMLGMIPYSFTVTSHILITVILGLIVFFAVTLTGFARHGLHFFSLFIPHGTPLLLAVASGGFTLALLPLPVLINVALTGFEFFVAGLQAYIFSILAAVYLHDALELH
ncbi:MAG: ATP synthase F0 subunit A [Alphaproteobacteria bacterium]|nr:ATP synthase F0 subunit A [Alphaproteobacteria bacterium]